MSDETTPTKEPPAPDQPVAPPACRECRATLVEGAAFCQTCGEPVGHIHDEAQLAVNVQKLSDEVTRLNTELDSLRERHNKLEVTVNKNADAHNKLLSRLNSNVFSKDFWPRAWAIYGHAITIGVIIGTGIYALGFLVFGY